MKPYKNYKNSGVEWIGKIPEHWEVKKLKYLVNLVDETIEDTDFLIAVENIESKTSKLINLESGKQYQGTVNRFNKGDTLFNKLRPYLTKVYYAEREGGCIGELLVLRSNGELNDKFLFYRTISGGFIHVVDGSTYGTKMPRANWGDFISQLPIPVPTFPEQKQIAAYLDKKCGEIDVLIANKRRLVELLREERSAVINHAVTRGLDPNVKLKNSGIEWIGKIPEHWEVKKLKYLVAVKLQYGANETAEIEDESLPRYIRITDFGDDGKLRPDTFKSLPVEIAKEYLLKSGDILFARSGATVGKTFQFKNYCGKACFAGYLIKATPNEQKILSDYLYLFTKSGSYDYWKNAIFNQATIQNIGADKYNFLIIPVPPLLEQKQIAAYLDKKCGEIDTVLSYTEREIELLQEYRTALISEVVTGKVKVTQ
jgi:restriction endonuclease S subunit